MSAKPSRGKRGGRRTSAADRLLAAEALLWLAAARLLVIALPFRALARLAERSRTGTDTPAPQTVRKIAWALNAAGARAPWRCKCLERAIGGTIMLRLRRYPATLLLGVARPAPGGELKAHAWLRCGELPVVGEEAPVDDYAVVARLSAAARETGAA